MAWENHSYAHLSTQDGPQQLDDRRSLHAPSFTSNHSYEMQPYQVEADQTRLLADASQGHYGRDDASFLTGTTEASRDFAKSGPGLWANQMLVDRSLRGMALLTSIFALGMMIVVFVWTPDYARNRSGQSTAVFAAEESCKAASSKNIVRI
jgi:hypothetical protein